MPGQAAQNGHFKGFTAVEHVAGVELYGADSTVRTGVDGADRDQNGVNTGVERSTSARTGVEHVEHGRASTTNTAPTGTRSAVRRCTGRPGPVHATGPATGVRTAYSGCSATVERVEHGQDSTAPAVEHGGRVERRRQHGRAEAPRVTPWSTCTASSFGHPVADLSTSSNGAAT